MMYTRINIELLTVFIILYSMIILTGLRAFVISGKISDLNNTMNASHQEWDDFSMDSDLSFLDGFIYEDTNVTLPVSVAVSDKKIAKRSISSHLVPQFMLDMYEYLSDKRLKAKFDIARCYRSTGVTVIQDSSVLKGNYLNFTKRKITFNISSLPATEEIQFAQLRIHPQMEISEEKIGTKMKIKIYDETPDNPRKIASQQLVFTKTSLIADDITSSMQSALSSRATELQFVVVLQQAMDDAFIWNTADEEGPQLLVLSKVVQRADLAEDPVFKRMKRSLEEKFGDSIWTENVENGYTKVYSNNSREVNVPQNRVKRSEEEDEEAEEQSNYIVEELGRVRKGKMKKKKNPCRRKPLHINFAAINYDQWIIAPPSYEAFECTGRCSFPMSAHLTPTKHAIIQTLMHSLEPKQVSRACCVPTKLDSISVLYLDDDGTVTYKYDYGEMIVAECGCR